ncbi:MAG: thiamine pyrophosphate-binding protein [Clostridium sp.]|uniref:thiamine pyrophosphate-binding protein n=1 Tax=Clostridium sp. TaxID=1506 RepID=UPI0029127EAB|nr:thiamine pyrophosphate-binding protein [Clostridium sp.]MDU7337848.1 thiamine pyrophosphate-binding protein [Clostridium sp.]
MKKLLSYQIVDYLERRDVKYVFGLCGHTVIAMLDALKDSKKLKFISVRHEQIASTAADGYARITKKASVVMCHLGPGLSNATTGVLNAALDSIPMVVIAGDVPSYYYGKHPHQEVNMHCDGSQYDMYKPFVKRAWRVDTPEMMPEILDKAFRLAESGRPGPVLISVPMDIFSREIDTEYFARTYRDSRITVRPALDPDVAKEIASKLVAAKQPVLHAGGGILSSGASDELAALAEFLDIPISRTLMGQGCVPDTHPLMLGQTGFWGFELTHKMTTEADVILALGTRLAEADSSSWYEGVTFDSERTHFLQIDIDPSEIGRNYPVDIGAIADLKPALKQILAEVKLLCPEGRSHPELRATIAKEKAHFKQENQPICDDNRFPMAPQRILRDVKKLLPSDAIIVTDVGWNKNGMAQQYDIEVPGSIHHCSGLATMGFGSAALLGVKLAAPDKKVITLIGDGGFGTNPSVLAAAKEYGINVVWVVMNNAAFGTIAGLEAANYNTRFGTVFHTPNGERYTPQWSVIAQGYGIKSRKVVSADDFSAALKEALEADEPYLLDVPMENIVVPTPGCWNINDIYSPNELVDNGRLVKKENGKYVSPSHAKSHK